MYTIRCYNPKEYTNLSEYLKSQPSIKVSLLNSHHKDFISKLEGICKGTYTIIEYPRELSIELGWIISRVDKKILRNLRLELLDVNYKSKGVNEILVIGSGYDEQ